MMGSLAVVPTPTVGQTSTAQQQELAEVEKLNQQVIELYKQGKFREAIELLQKFFVIWLKV